MAVYRDERRSTFKARKMQAEVISKTIENATRAECTVFMRKFAVNRVDVIVIVYSGERAESCVA